MLRGVVKDRGLVGSEVLAIRYKLLQLGDRDVNLIASALLDSVVLLLADLGLASLGINSFLLLLVIFSGALALLASGRRNHDNRGGSSGSSSLLNVLHSRSSYFVVLQ